MRVKEINQIKKRSLGVTQLPVHIQPSLGEVAMQTHLSDLGPNRRDI